MLGLRGQVPIGVNFQSFRIFYSDANCQMLIDQRRFYIGRLYAKNEDQKVKPALIVAPGEPYGPNTGSPFTQLNVSVTARKDFNPELVPPIKFFFFI